LLGVSAVLLLVTGCSRYSLVRYDGGLGDVHSVAITTPSNESYESGLEYMVADALRREFLRRRGVRVVEDKQSADLVIRGRVVSVRSSARSFSSVIQSLEYEVTLNVALEAVRPDGTLIEIDPRATRESERYLASADVEVQRKNRQEALREVSRLLAGRVYDALYESLVQ
jgi:hypothetical protein